MDNYAKEVDALLTAGALLANCAFNLAQSDKLDARQRCSLDDSRKAWDAALSNFPATLRQQAGRVDEGMVEVAERVWHANEGTFSQRMKLALTAALAQNTQGEDKGGVWQYRVKGSHAWRDAEGPINSDYNREEWEVRRVYLHAERARVPEGWVLVPREPTDAMIEAAFSSDSPGNDPSATPDYAAAYKAMLAAAPSQPKDAGEGGKLSCAELLGPPIPQEEADAMREAGVPGWDDDATTQPEDAE